MEKILSRVLIALMIVFLILGKIIEIQAVKTVSLVLTGICALIFLIITIKEEKKKKR